MQHFPMTKPPSKRRLRPGSELVRLAALLLLGLFAPGAGVAQVAPLEDLANFPSDKLEILDGKKVRHVFQVWLADSPQRQAQGLMFVRSLPEMRGMLFVYGEPRSIGMWPCAATGFPRIVAFTMMRPRAGFSSSAGGGAAADGGGSSPALAAGAKAASEARLEAPHPSAKSANAVQLQPNILTLRTDAFRYRVLLVMASAILRLLLEFVSCARAKL